MSGKSDFMTSWIQEMRVSTCTIWSKLKTHLNLSEWTTRIVSIVVKPILALIIMAWQITSHFNFFFDLSMIKRLPYITLFFWTCHSLSYVNLMNSEQWCSTNNVLSRFEWFITITDYGELCSDLLRYVCVNSMLLSEYKLHVLRQFIQKRVTSNGGQLL